MIHHRAPRETWKPVMIAACQKVVRRTEVAQRWSGTTCPECLETRGIQPRQASTEPSKADLIRIGYVLEKATGTSWPPEKRDAIALAAWRVVGKLLRRVDHGGEPVQG